MDLAMTYASRSHHLRLARQISELSQQKYQEGSDLELSDEEGGWTNQNGHADDQAFSYAQERSKSLQKGLSRLSPVARSNDLAKQGSKFNKYMKAMKNKKFTQTTSMASHTHSAAAHREYVYLLVEEGGGLTFVLPSYKGLLHLATTRPLPTFNQTRLLSCSVAPRTAVLLSQ